jgi:superfamily II DNA or RNA helicase
MNYTKHFVYTKITKTSKLSKSAKTTKTTENPVIEQPIITPEYQSLVSSQSYLGKKGYTISKSILSKEDLEELYKELYVKPVVLGVNYGGNNDEANAFPVYRENSNKIYIPRFYGISRYGMPNKCEIQQGDDISIDFVKPLRDYQDNIIKIYMDYVTKPICNGSLHNGSGGILEVPCGRGKCLGKDTPILMYDGTIKMVQDICVGDVLMGDDSTPRNVLTLARGKETMVEIKQTGSENKFIVNMSHILSLKHSITDEIFDLSIEKYLNHPEKDKLLSYRNPIHFIEKHIYYNNYYNEPYLLGYNIYKNLDFIDEYICNSRSIQCEILAGLVDRFIYLDKIKYCICIEDNSSKIKNTVLFLTRSLGFETVFHSTDKDSDRCIIQIKNTKYANLNEIPTRIRNIEHYEISALQFSSLSYQFETNILEQNDYYGFEIDGNHRFVLGDFTVTHNTVMGLKIISLLKKKTLIIVHKEFLMNQWIERIGEFLPTATVGKIQGQVFDVKGNDIVIGMVQTLYDKEYPADAFSCFGLTIIDEVHRIGSEQFSRTLFKTITPYMLGISATVDRKDKLTRVLHMFIGDKIYSETRDDDDPVCVRAIQYKTDDPVFNEVDLDFRGNPKYSSMIVKLCNYNRRSDFIVRIIGDLIEEDPEKQIMVLCHNRSLLTYLYDAVEHRKIASVGYYVGGMKQANLQATETKQIVLATYAMAAEALDIKTLSTLIMVTPKTDITQSVGRILRVKHEKPIIVDIIDNHDIFQNQWAQRKRFYKKSNYRIRQIDSAQYVNMKIDWDEDVTWKKVYEPKDKTSTNNNNKSVDSNEEKEQKTVFGGKCLINISNL